MEKAYDLKALGQMISERLKADHGLTVAEEALEKIGESVYHGTKDWAKQSAAISENKIDDLAAKFYDYADQYVLPQIKKIDLDGNEATETPA